MNDPKRLLLLKALCEYLTTEVTTDNGYNYTLLRAYRGKKNFGKELKVPAVAVLENFNPDRLPQKIGGVIGTKQTYDQLYLINGWAHVEDEDDEDEGVDSAHRLMADVKTALGKLLVRNNQAGFFGGLSITMEIEPGVVRPPDEQSTRAYFWMRIRMEVVEKVGDPYWIRDN